LESGQYLIDVNEISYKKYVIRLSAAFIFQICTKREMY